MVFSDYCHKLRNVSPRTRRLFVLFLIVVAVFGLYYPSLKNGFAYDDEAQIVLNPYVKDLVYIPRVFTSCIWEHSLPSCKGYADYYRPTQTLSYLLTYSLSASAALFHLVNILYYVILIFLLFLLLEKLFDDYLVVGLTLFLSIFQPVHSEAVMWIASVPELLFAIFAALALIVYVSGWRYRYWLAPALFFLSLLSKETAIFLPLIIFIYDSLWKRLRINWRYILSYWRYALFFTVYLFLRVSAIGIGRNPGDENYAFSVRDGFLRTTFVFGEYLKKIFWPADLNPFMPFELPRGIFDAVFVSNLILTIIFIAVFTWAIYKKNKVLVFGLSFYVLFLLPALFALNFTGKNIIAERYLLLPSFGFALIVGFYIARFIRQGNLVLRIGAAAIILAVGGFWSIKVHTQNAVWQSSKTLYEYIHDKNKKRGYPADATTINLALIYNKEGRVAEAKSIYEEIIRNERNVPTASHRAYNNLGVIYFREDRLSEATDSFKKSTEVNPRNKSAYGNLALVYLREEKYLAALENGIKALEIDPAYDEARGILVGLYATVSEFADSPQSEKRKIFNNFVLGMLNDPIWKNWEYEKEEERRSEVLGTAPLRACRLIGFERLPGGSLRAEVSISPEIKGAISRPMIFGATSGKLKPIAEEAKRFDFNPLGPRIIVVLDPDIRDLYLVLKDFRYYRFEVPVF